MQREGFCENMLGTRIFTASLFWIAAATAQVAYWPLNPGNIWVYKTADRGFITVKVVREETLGERTFSVVQGLPSGEAWLRTDEEGSIYSLDRASNRESLWYKFGASIGEGYETAVPGAAGRAQLQSRNASYSGPVGTFSNALRIAYPGTSQPGVDSELFLPSVGLVQRNEIAGIVPTRWELVYSSLGGVTFISQPETSFTVSASAQLSAPVPQFSPSLDIRMTLRHTASSPLSLTFSSGQTFEIVVYNDQGRRVYVWSADKTFAQVIRNETIRGEQTWTAQVPLPLKGRYVIEAVLTTSGGPVFRGVVPFEY